MLHVGIINIKEKNHHCHQNYVNQYIGLILVTGLSIGARFPDCNFLK